MEDFLPSAAIAHFVMKVKNIESSYDFYQGLGLRGFDKFPGMAIIELRGGTHLLLAAKDDPITDTLHDSRVGQRGAVVGDDKKIGISRKRPGDTLQNDVFVRREISQGWDSRHTRLPSIWSLFNHTLSSYARGVALTEVGIPPI